MLTIDLPDIEVSPDRPTNQSIVNRWLTGIRNYIFGSIDLTSYYIAREVYRALVRSTPVRTGAARASWTVSDSGLPPPSYVSKPDMKTWDGTVFPAPEFPYSSASRSRSRVSYTIGSDCPYMEILDGGSSAQAPSGFIDRAITMGTLRGQDLAKDALR